ncbi:MAG: TSUP family transporter [Candidatus Peribacteraceae bacterium]|nr:TSUP family transporter [Candidatus Peribacteraceae bacterium]
MIESLPIILLVLFLGSVFCTIAGAGLGIIGIILLTFFVDIRTSIVVLSLIGFIIQPAKFIHFYKFTRWDIACWYLILGIPFSFLGGLIFFQIPMRSIEILLAIFCILFIFIRLSPRGFTIQPTKTNFLLCGALNGFQSGIIGVGTLLRSSFLLSMGLVKEPFLGTSCVIAFGLNIGRITAYLPNIVWAREIFMVLICSIPIIIIGVKIGKKLMKYVSERIFENLLLFVIFAGAIKLLLFA